VLPDGDHVLFSVAGGSQVLEAQWDEARIVVQSLSSGERVVVLEGGTEATYLASGHLVYVAGDTLFGVPFDVGELAVSGVPVPLVQNVLRPDTGQGTAHYDVAGNGTLVYANGSAFSRMLYWVNREGEEEPVGAPPRVYAVPRLSPDESAVALQADGDLWIYSLARGTLERLTADAGRDSDPVWSPDGSTIAYYAVGRDGGPGLFRRAANGTGDVERLAAGTRLPLSWSPDGSRLVFIDFGSNPIANPATAPLAADVDLGVVVFEGVPTLRPLLTTGVREDVARISPDGRWLAVETNETGQMEIFVRPFPQVDGARWRISPAGGNDPIWSRDGGALFYRQDRRIMEVLVIGPNPSAWGRPRPVLELDTAYYFTNGPTHFDVASDGRFLMLKDTLADPGRAPQFVVVLNWREELKRQVPTD
jgi:serine/threonine-protein kinase